MAQVAAAEVEEAGRAFLAELPPADKGVAARLPLILGLSPGAEFGPAKRWPAERFAAVAREVSRRFASCVWLVFGGTKDRELCEEIARAAGAKALNLAGRTSLRQLMALLKLCRVLLTNDSGPMHLAAALGTPVVVPFGSTSPELTGPGLPGDERQRHRLLSSRAGCAPCFRRACPIDFRCMTGLSVEAGERGGLGGPEGPVTKRSLGVRRQSEAATALWAARGVRERQTPPEPKRCRAPLATALQSGLPEKALPDPFLRALRFLLFRANTRADR